MKAAHAYTVHPRAITELYNHNSIMYFHEKVGRSFGVVNLSPSDKADTDRVHIPQRLHKLVFVRVRVRLEYLQRLHKLEYHDYTN